MQLILQIVTKLIMCSCSAENIRVTNSIDGRGSCQFSRNADERASAEDDTDAKLLSDIYRSLHDYRISRNTGEYSGSVKQKDDNGNKSPDFEKVRCKPTSTWKEDSNETVKNKTVIKEMGGTTKNEEKRSLNVAEDSDKPIHIPTVEGSSINEEKCGPINCEDDTRQEAELVKYGTMKSNDEELTKSVSSDLNSLKGKSEKRGLFSWLFKQKGKYEVSNAKTPKEIKKGQGKISKRKNAGTELAKAGLIPVNISSENASCDEPSGKTRCNSFGSGRYAEDYAIVKKKGARKGAINLSEADEYQNSIENQTRLTEKSVFKVPNITITKDGDNPIKILDGSSDTKLPLGTKQPFETKREDIKTFVEIHTGKDMQQQKEEVQIRNDSISSSKSESRSVRDLKNNKIKMGVNAITTQKSGMAIEQKQYSQLKEENVESESSDRNKNLSLQESCQEDLRKYREATSLGYGQNKSYMTSVDRNCIDQYTPEVNCRGKHGAEKKIIDNMTFYTGQLTSDDHGSSGRRMGVKDDRWNERTTSSIKETSKIKETSNKEIKRDYQNIFEESITSSNERKQEIQGSNLNKSMETFIEDVKFSKVTSKKEQDKTITEHVLTKTGKSKRIIDGKIVKDESYKETSRETNREGGQEYQSTNFEKQQDLQARENPQKVDIEILPKISEDIKADFGNNEVSELNSVQPSIPEKNNEISKSAMSTSRLSRKDDEIKLKISEQTSKDNKNKLEAIKTDHQGIYTPETERKMQSLEDTCKPNSERFKVEKVNEKESACKIKYEEIDLNTNPCSSSNEDVFKGKEAEKKKQKKDKKLLCFSFKNRRKKDKEKKLEGENKISLGSEKTSEIGIEDINDNTDDAKSKIEKEKIKIREMIKRTKTDGNKPDFDAKNAFKNRESTFSDCKSISITGFDDLSLKSYCMEQESINENKNFVDVKTGDGSITSFNCRETRENLGRLIESEQRASNSKQKDTIEFIEMQTETASSYAQTNNEKFPCNLSDHLHPYEHSTNIHESININVVEEESATARGKTTRENLNEARKYFFEPVIKNIQENNLQLPSTVERKNQVYMYAYEQREGHSKIRLPASEFDPYSVKLESKLEKISKGNKELANHNMTLDRKSALKISKMEKIDQYFENKDTVEYQAEDASSIQTNFEEKSSKRTFSEEEEIPRTSYNPANTSSNTKENEIKESLEKITATYETISSNLSERKLAIKKEKNKMDVKYLEAVVEGGSE